MGCLASRDGGGNLALSPIKEKGTQRKGKIIVGQRNRGWKVLAAGGKHFGEQGCTTSTQTEEPHLNPRNKNLSWKGKTVLIKNNVVKGGRKKKTVFAK